MTHETWRPKKDAWEPADYDDDVVLARRALAKGVANAAQQQLLNEWLRYVCAADDWAFRPGDPRSTDIVLGRQFVWQQFEKMLHPALTPKDKTALAELQGRSVRPFERPLPLAKPSRKGRKRV